MPEDPSAIGPFRLLGRLGSGGMGRVYLARSAGGRTVAVKVVHAELAAQDEFRRRFAREVGALERVGGTGTAPLLGADTDAESPWVAIGYVAGPSLRTIVGSEYGPLPPASVRALGAGLARALEHIHGAGLLHRDLKPANILLTVDGPQLIDFGIARAVDTVTDGGLTSTGAVVGSPGFMSPEQVRGERLTPASDVFCLGSVLAYAATGRAPFGTSDSGVHAMMFRIAHDEPDLEGLPPELDGLVRHCLAKDPDARPTAAELATRLATEDTGAEPWLPAEVLAGLGRHAARLLDADGDPTPVDHPMPLDARADTPVDAAPKAPRPPKPAGRWRRWLLAVAIVVLPIMVPATVFVYTYDGPTPPPMKPKTDTGAFVGAWEGAVRGSAVHPRETLRIEIRRGTVGDKVAVYSNVTGERFCMGRSTLTDIGPDGKSVTMSRSEVTLSLPATRCMPAPDHALKLRSDDVLEWSSGAVTATLRKVRAGDQTLSAGFSGVWERRAQEENPETPPDLFNERITLTRGPVGADFLRLEQTNPELDGETGERTGRLLNCTSTGILAAAGDVVVVGHLQLDEEASDRRCEPNSLSAVPSQALTLRLERKDLGDRLVVVPFGEDTEPSLFARVR